MSRPKRRLAGDPPRGDHSSPGCPENWRRHTVEDRKRLRCTCVWDRQVRP